MAIGDMITVFINKIVERYGNDVADKAELEDLWKIISEQKCNYMVKKNTPDEYMCNKTVKTGDKCYKHSVNKKVVKIADIDKCCIHIIRKKDNTEERCTRIGKQNNLCSKHFTVKKIKNDGTQKCRHIIHKKNKVDLQCTRNAIDDGDYCKKHVKKSNDEDDVDEEETEEEMMAKMEKEMDDEMAAAVDKDVEDEEEKEDTTTTTTLAEEDEELLTEINKYTSLFSDDEKEIKCSHLIHKKNNTKVQCNKIAVDGGEYCSKHNKGKKSSTVCYI